MKVGKKAYCPNFTLLSPCIKSRTYGGYEMPPYGYGVWKLHRTCA